MRHSIIVVLFLLLAALPLTAGVRIASIEVIGNQRTDSAIIMNYLYFRQGDRMSRQELEEKLEKSRTRLLNTRYFSDADVTILSEEGDNINLRVTVEEGFLWRLNGGIWFVELGRDNLFGKGVNGDLYLSKKTHSVSLNNPYFKGSPFLLQIHASHQVADRDIVFVDPEENFDFERYGISGSVGYNFSPDISFALTTGLYSFDLRSEDLNADALTFLRDNFVYGRTRDTDLGILFRMDRRGDRLIPSDGYFLNGGLRYRDGVPGVELQLLDYLKTGKRTYLFTRISLTSFGNRLPYHLWQGLGGIWGVKFPGSEDEVGRSTALISIEPRFRFIEVPSRNAFLEARLFYDTGVAFLEAADFSFDRFVSGYGAGLRLWIGYPYFQNVVLYYGIRKGEGEIFFRFGSSF